MNKQCLNIFVDSLSIEESLSNYDPNVETFLSYIDTETFRFIRSPYNTKYESLAKIQYYVLERDTGADAVIRIKTRDYDNQEIRLFFSSEMSYVEELAKETLKNDFPTEEEKEAMLMVLIHRDLILDRFYNGKAIFVTENKKLLRNRIWLRSQLFSELDIMRVHEAMEMMDLFSKIMGRYYLKPSFISDKKGWYWFSFRSKVLHYHVPNRGAKKRTGI